MKRLAEFADEAGIVLVAKLMLPIGRLSVNPEITAERLKAADEKGNVGFLELASIMLQAGARDVMEILALLNEEDPAEYHCTAATVMGDVMQMLQDPDMQSLFGLQSETRASSGSASETTGARGTSGASSDTPQPDSGEKPKRRSGEPT